MKKYTFEVIIDEGNDEFWESINHDSGCGCKEVIEMVRGALAAQGMFHGKNCTVNLKKCNEHGKDEVQMDEANKNDTLADSPTFLPYLHDMLSSGVPEAVAMRWNNAIRLLMSHCEHMAEVIEEQTGDKEVLREAAMNARKAMSDMRPFNTIMSEAKRDECADGPCKYFMPNNVKNGQ